jgi:16S rRNA (cytosine1402-N4)-methyltransferase
LNSASTPPHTPVLLAEVLQHLAPRPSGLYVDATFGAGGYARAILDQAPCSVIGIDRDPSALAAAADLISASQGRLVVIHGCFGDLADLLARHGYGPVDGIAFDLGVSSMQLDRAERGFSFRLDGPLDMRMDPAVAQTAADVVNRCSEQELAQILWVLGEERLARRIARAIVGSRTEAPILRTGQLAQIVHRVAGSGDTRIDSATRTFQALRLYVNDEMGELDRGLAAAERLLRPGGRLCVVAFHSLEDRRVKSFLRLRSGTAPNPSRHRPEAGTEPEPPSFRLISSRAIRPSKAEIDANPRARSARLRAAERTAAPPWSSEGRRAA